MVSALVRKPLIFSCHKALHTPCDCSAIAHVLHADGWVSRENTVPVLTNINKAFLLVQVLEVSLGGPKLPCIYLDTACCLASSLTRRHAGI